jgi:hypothetical protein
MTVAHPGRHQELDGGNQILNDGNRTRDDGGATLDDDGAIDANGTLHDGSGTQNSQLPQLAQHGSGGKRSVRTGACLDWLITTTRSCLCMTREAVATYLL